MQPRNVEEAARSMERALIETKWIGLGLLLFAAVMIVALLICGA